MRAPRERGFTLIELLIALSIFAFLIMIAGPMYADFMGNTQIRTAAESALGGLRRAQVEAVRSNTQGRFVLDPTPVTGGWTASVYNDGDGVPEAFDPSCRTDGAQPRWCVVDSYTWANGASKVSIDGGGFTEVTFNALGRIVPNSQALVNADASSTIQLIKVTNPNVSSGSQRPLWVVVVDPSGPPAGTGTSAIKLCDPASTVTSDDPRYCFAPTS